MLILPVLPVVRDVDAQHDPVTDGRPRNGLAEYVAEFLFQTMENARLGLADSGRRHTHVFSDINGRPILDGALPECLPGPRLELAADEFQAAMMKPFYLLGRILRNCGLRRRDLKPCAGGPRNRPGHPAEVVCSGSDRETCCGRWYAASRESCLPADRGGTGPSRSPRP